VFALTNLWGGIGRITTSVTPGHHQPRVNREMLAGEMSGR